MSLLNNAKHICCSCRWKVFPVMKFSRTATRSGSKKVNYYDVLGISHTATNEDVKAAFLSKSKKLHPDVSSDPKSHEEFKLLNEAYNALKTNRERMLYNRTIREEPVMKDRYFREGDALYDTLTGRVLRDDGTLNVGKSTAKTYRRDRKEARKRNLQLLGAIFLFTFAYASTNYLFIVTTSKKSVENDWKVDSDEEYLKLKCPEPEDTSPKTVLS